PRARGRLWRPAMRKSWVAGFLAFSVVLIVGARHESVDEFLVWAGICASDSRTPARSASLVLAAVQNASKYRVAPLSGVGVRTESRSSLPWIRRRAGDHYGSVGATSAP